MLHSLSKLQGRVKSKVHKKWQLFHATDFQSLMDPCFTICLILGVFPYKINASIFEISRIRYILSIVVGFFFCCYGLMIFYHFHITKTFMYKSVPLNLQNNCFFLLGNFIVIITFVLSKQRMRLLQSVLDVSAKLSLESFQKLSKLFHVKDIIGFLFLIGQIPNCIGESLFNISIKFYVLYIFLVVFQMDMLYMNCVCVLKACFKAINDNLANMRELMNDEPHLLRRVYHEQRNPFLLMELKALKKQHLIVSDTVQLLNITFSLQLLATTVLTFAEITFKVYFSILWFFGKTNNFEEPISLITLGIIYYAIKIMLIVWACETGKDQGLKIGTTAHDVLISTSDKQIKDELQLFSLQILHRDNEFSAKGLTVDATLLTAIVGSITTYLLILIQFMLTTISCDTQTNNTQSV